MVHWQVQLAVYHGLEGPQAVCQQEVEHQEQLLLALEYPEIVSLVIKTTSLIECMSEKEEIYVGSIATRIHFFQFSHKIHQLLV